MSGLESEGRLCNSFPPDSCIVLGLFRRAHHSGDALRVLRLRSFHINPPGTGRCCELDDKHTVWSRRVRFEVAIRESRRHPDLLSCFCHTVCEHHENGSLLALVFLLGLLFFLSDQS